MATKKELQDTLDALEASGIIRRIEPAESIPRTLEVIKKGLEDSEKFLKEKYPWYPNDANLTKIDIREFLAGFAVATEVCTLRWVLGNSVLNCYGVIDTSLPKNKFYKNTKREVKDEPKV